ncbi:MAG: hypothetical protein NVS1B13_15170 [Flavisolibacter sp.]
MEFYKISEGLGAEYNRRKFISDTSKAAGTLILLSPFSSFSNSSEQKKDLTVGDIIDRFISEVPGGAMDKTVDTLKSGSRDTIVTGIVTSMFATVEVIRKAIGKGANFIIAHEPTFYNHEDSTEWLKGDVVYKYKSDLLKQNGIALWRNHDYIHRHRPDGVYQALVSKLGWERYFNFETSLASIPPQSLKQVMEIIKQNLDIHTQRYVGSINQVCKRILLLAGAPGGHRQITEIEKHKPDVIVCGEIQEWETSEYVRDARAMGEQLSLVVIGHIPSEESGSQYMADWINKKFSGLPVWYEPATYPFSYF